MAKHELMQCHQSHTKTRARVVSFKYKSLSHQSHTKTRARVVSFKYKSLSQLKKVVHFL
jgi:hypothetical protein